MSFREQFKGHTYVEYAPGEHIQFHSRVLLPDRSVVYEPHNITVDKVVGGGFFGRVILPKNTDYVIKT